MFEALDQIDRQLFLFLNGLHSPFWDQWMDRFTSQLFWIWLFLLILAGLYYNYRPSKLLNSFLFALVPLVVCIVLADHTASSLFKPLIGRLRPCHQPDIMNHVHFPSGCGGTYGFFSSHASNSFTVAAYLLFSFRKGIKWWSLPVFAWAVIFSYSRIYLGKHYPLDILCGAICGVLIAWFITWLRDKYFGHKLLRA